MELTFAELRVLGCLIEKWANTPENYPLTSNALAAACNQKTSREPVVSFSTREVDEAVLLLRQAGLARTNSGGRSPKHRHVFDEALGLTREQTILLSVLMLRGPQSVGELRARTDRSIGFDEIGPVSQVLRSLAKREEPLVKDVGRGPGQSQNRWVHQLGDGSAEPNGLTGSDPGIQGATNSQVSLSERAHLVERIDALEARLCRLETALGVESEDELAD